MYGKCKKRNFPEPNFFPQKFRKAVGKNRSSSLLLQQDGSRLRFTYNNRGGGESPVLFTLSSVYREDEQEGRSRSLVSLDEIILSFLSLLPPWRQFVRFPGGGWGG